MLNTVVEIRRTFCPENLSW